MPTLQEIYNWPETRAALGQISAEWKRYCDIIAIPDLVEQLGDKLTPKLLQLYLAALDQVPEHKAYYNDIAFPALMVAFGNKLTPELLQQYFAALELVPAGQKSDYTGCALPAMVRALGDRFTADDILPLTRQYVAALKQVPAEWKNLYTEFAFPTLVKTMGDKLTPELLQQYVAVLKKVPAEQKSDYTQHVLPAMVATLGDRFTADDILPLTQLYLAVLETVPAVCKTDLTAHAFPNMVRGLGKRLKPEMIILYGNTIKYGLERLDPKTAILFANSLIEVAIAENALPLQANKFDELATKLLKCFNASDSANGATSATPFGFEVEFDSTNPNHMRGHSSQAECSPPPFRTLAGAQEFWQNTREIIKGMKASVQASDSPKDSVFLTCHLNIGLNACQAQAFTNHRIKVTDILNLLQLPQVPFDRALSAHTPGTYLNIKLCHLRNDKIVSVDGLDIKHRIEYKGFAIASPRETPVENLAQIAQFTGWLTTELAEGRMDDNHLYRIKEVMQMLSAAHNAHTPQAITDMAKKYPKIFKSLVNPKQKVRKQVQAIWDYQEIGHRRRSPALRGALGKFMDRLMTPNADVHAVLQSYQDGLQNRLTDNGPETYHRKDPRELMAMAP